MGVELVAEVFHESEAAEDKTDNRMMGQEASTSGRDGIVEVEEEEALWRLALGPRPFSLSLMLILMRDSLAQGKDGRLDISRAAYGITRLARRCQGSPQVSEWQNGFDSLSPGQKQRYGNFLATLENQLTRAVKGHCEFSGGSSALIQLLHGLAVMGRNNSNITSRILALLAANGQLSTGGSWVTGLKSWEVIKLAWSLASLRWKPSSTPGGIVIVKELFRTSVSLMMDLGFCRASSLAWSMARIATPSQIAKDALPYLQDWWESLEAATMIHEQEVVPSEKMKHGQAVALIWASGRLRPHCPRPSPQWMRGLLSVIEAKAGLLTPTETTMLMEGLAVLRYRPPDILINGMMCNGRAGLAGSRGKVGVKPSVESFSASQLQGLLASSASLGYRVTPSPPAALLAGPNISGDKEEGLNEPLHSTFRDSVMASAPFLVKTRLGGMSARQLLQTASSLQEMGLDTPDADFVIQWTEECHSKFPSFSPLQMVQLLRVLSRWKVAPGSPWLSDLICASSKQMHAFSRSRLVEFLHEFSSPTLGFTADESWLQTILECFISRNFKEPRPQHFISFTQSVSAIAPREGSHSVHLSDRTRQLLRKALPRSKVQWALSVSNMGEGERQKTLDALELLELK